MSDGDLAYAPPGLDRLAPVGRGRVRTRVFDVCDRSRWYIGSRCAPANPLTLSGGPPAEETGPLTLTWDGPDVYGVAIGHDSEVRAVRIGTGGGSSPSRSALVVPGLESLVEGAPLRLSWRNGDLLTFDRLDRTDGLLRIVVALTPEGFDDLPLVIRPRTTVVLDGDDALIVGRPDLSGNRVVWLDLDAHRAAGAAARTVIGRVYSNTMTGNVTVHGLILSPRDGRVYYESAALATIAIAGGAAAQIGPVDLAGYDAARLRFPSSAGWAQAEVSLV